ncbi:MAG: bifunctional diaminohydroxyphosphoribosylaminopyrimidine deaminase/5-amino-6-(5-phosphoribosylamino)uracil reductase RibD [Nitrospirae bacterium]|nr:bifunctional diaminohydroxyphosphoribosylaminopyrimidine deaminase/5-amino-6-(5-phosphoribosylamino)uracil reductase RibD [Nitrospirota bacterium]
MERIWILGLKKFSDRDILYMKRALRLAKKGCFTASPNPMVGAVIVKNNKIISEGFHKMPGALHAEAAALALAGPKAKGAAMYVTLEPCCHTDKKTPPCTRAIIASGIKRVYVAMQDPNPKVSGKGMRELAENGIDVISGVLESDARKLNEAYFKYITTGMPFVILKTAMTLDGRIADAQGDSKWITSEKSRILVHRIRSSVDFLLTGVGTVLADNPCFTSRIKGGRNPKLIIIDPELRTPMNFSVCKTVVNTTFVVRRSSVPQERMQRFIDAGFSVLKFDSEVLEIKWLLKKLGESGISSVMIEAGSRLNAHAVSQGVVDKFLIFVAPKILADSKAMSVFESGVFRPISEAFRLRNTRLKRVGSDFLIEAYPDFKPTD